MREEHLDPEARRADAEPDDVAAGLIGGREESDLALSQLAHRRQAGDIVDWRQVHVRHGSPRVAQRDEIGWA